MWPQIEGNAVLKSKSQPTELSGDTLQLEQMLMDLFRNAVEDGGSDVIIRVGALSEERY